MIKLIRLVLLSALFLATGCGSRQNIQPDLLILATPDAPDANVASVATFFEKYYGLAPRTVRPEEDVWRTQGHILGIIDSVRNPSDRIVVVLSTSQEGQLSATNAVLRLRDDITTVSLAALHRSASGLPIHQEKKAHRSEKESMRALGEIVGLTPCLNPHCCMFPHSTEAELDAKGRNQCPPCHLRSLELLKEQGFILFAKRDARLRR
jgi:hypothetical protein